ncbi:ATP-binding protein [Streptomyces sp. SUK 48]|uniref:ATP-binding protein n=1 Tax=Streptomyces sp. SUK 48 TaxID=2582831 RepID=UPI0018911432|nr:ATP-binding protein [Streptomyces sp. SUK 48]
MALCSLPATTAAVPALRRFTCDTADRWALPADTRDALSLVVTELVTNTVLHRGSPEVTLLLTHKGSALTVEVKDAGRRRTRRTARVAAEDADASCGRGLNLVRHCTSWWLALLTAAGTTVVAWLPVDAAAA